MMQIGILSQIREDHENGSKIQIRDDHENGSVQEEQSGMGIGCKLQQHIKLKYVDAEYKVAFRIEFLSCLNRSLSRC